MKRILILALVVFLLAGFAVTPVLADQGGKNAGCTTIQDGTLLDSKGNVIEIGRDQWGYNYQAHTYNGWWDNYSRPDTVYQGTWGSPDETWLWMKWNEAWLSNKSCDGDSLLDRHSGYSSYIGSGAWLTNHLIGWYTGSDGNVHQWHSFVKIVAAPADATKVLGVWYAADGTEIGPDIWGSFAIIQGVTSDPYGEYPGRPNPEEFIEYLSPLRAGLGNW